MINFKTLILIALVFSLSAATLFSGDPIPGIDITLRNTETNKTMKTKTNRSGKFRFNNLKPGTYIVELSFKGERMTIGGSRSESLVILPKDKSSGLATGKRQHKPITVTKEIDKASPKLAEAVCSGNDPGKPDRRNSMSADYNSSRSNNSSTKSTGDYDSSRSNRTGRTKDSDKCSPVVKLVVTKNSFRGHVTVLK